MAEATRTEQGKTVARAASMTHNYTWDVGYAHVIHRVLYLTTLDCIAYGRSAYLVSNQGVEYISQQRIGRYLDGEEEREGSYR